MLIVHKGHTDTIQVYSVTVMTHVKALQPGHSSQGTSEPITPACTPADRVVAAVTPPPVEPGDLEAVLRCLLPTALVPTPQHRPMPTDMELLLECLLPACRDWTTVVCFSRGKPGYGMGRCPKLDETFLYRLRGWSAGTGGRQLHFTACCSGTSQSGKR